MDEATRRLEREAHGGDAAATGRLLTSLLRAGEPDEVLARTEAVPDQPGWAGVWGARARALSQLGRARDALRAAGRAVSDDARALGSADLEALARAALEGLESLDDGIERLELLTRCADLGDAAADLLRPWTGSRDLLERAAVARVPALGAALRDDPVALVRHLARGGRAAAPFPRESPPTRLFSAHGPDFEIGRFVAFEASCEDRLTCCDAALFHAVDALLGPGERALAFGLGYGLGLPSGEPAGELEERAAALDRSGLLPFPLRASFGQPFDRLQGKPAEGGLAPEDERLARRFATDMTRHPARLGAGDVGYPYARLLALFRPGSTPDPGAVAEVLEQARPVYGPVGQRALELFVELAQHETAGRPPRAPRGQATFGDRA